MPAGLRDFLAETSDLPTWGDMDQVREAERLFTQHGLLAVLTLICASLPECYTLATRAKILALTGQLGEHTNRRLHQTALLVLAVMFPRGLSPRGTGIRQAQKVRLIHAAIRHLIINQHHRPDRPTPAAAPRSVADVISRDLDWDIERDGWPINQEDMAYTLLTFGYVIPRGMLTLGVPVREDQLQAFVHTWNVVGYVMGVDESLMAHTWADAELLFTRIKARQAGASAAGAQLTDALIDVLEREVLQSRLLRPLAPVLVRLLVGEATAAMLGVHARHRAAARLFQSAVVHTVSRANAIARRLAGRFPPTTWIATWGGRKLVRLLVEVTGERAPLEVPDEIRVGWRV